MTVVKFIVAIILVICTAVSAACFAAAVKDNGENVQITAICSSLTLMLAVLITIVLVLQMGL